MHRRPHSFLACKENVAFRRTAIEDLGTQPLGRCRQLVLAVANPGSPQDVLHRPSWRTPVPTFTMLPHPQWASHTLSQIQMSGRSAQVRSTHGAAALQSHLQVVSSPPILGYHPGSKVTKSTGLLRWKAAMGRATRHQYSPSQVAEQADPRGSGGGRFTERQHTVQQNSRITCDTQAS